MDKQESRKTPAKGLNRHVFIIGGVVLVVAALILLAARLAEPKRSVAAYCQTYKEEKARLAKLPGDSWPSGVFNDSVGDAGEFVTSFGRLEKVAPEDVRWDVHTLKAAYKKIQDDPSQAISASLSGSSADEKLKSWTSNHCSLNER